MTLDRFQKKYIRDKMKLIGDPNEIKKLYAKDDEVTKYAMEQLEKGDYKKSKVKGRFKVVEFREVKVKKPEMYPSYEEAEQARRKLQLEEDTKIFVVRRK